MIGHNGRYILVDKVPQIETELIKGAMWFEDINNRFVARDQIADSINTGENIRVSTVFLGLDYSFDASKANTVPILFETMIFGGQHDDYQERYATYEQAEAGHKFAIQIAKGEIEPDGV